MDEQGVYYAGGVPAEQLERLVGMQAYVRAASDADVLRLYDQALRDILEGSVASRVGARLAVYYLEALSRGLVGPGADDTPLVWEDANGATRFLYRDCL